MEQKKKNHFSSKQLSISFSRFYRANGINRIQNLGQVLCWPREAGSWQLPLQLQEMLAGAGSSEVASGMCSWLPQCMGASCGIAAAGTATAPRDSSGWKDPVLLLSSPLGVGKRFPGLCSLFSQHVLLYLKLTFPPHPSQLVEYIPKSC